jgi:hypothetical protein
MDTWDCIVEDPFKPVVYVLELKIVTVVMSRLNTELEVKYYSKYIYYA